MEGALASSFESSEDGVNVLDHERGGETNIFEAEDDVISSSVSQQEDPSFFPVLLVGMIFIFLLNRYTSRTIDKRHRH